MKLRFVAFIFNFFIILFCLVGCGETVFPDYLIECASDNGFMPSYRAYYSFHDDVVKKISKRKYEDFVYSQNNSTYDYEFVSEETYTFDVKILSVDPVELELEQKYTDILTYDTEELNDRITAICLAHFDLHNMSPDDILHVIITEFDDYSIIEVSLANLVNNVYSIKSPKYFVFYNGEILSIPKNIELKSIRHIRRYKIL